MSNILIAILFLNHLTIPRIIHPFSKQNETIYIHAKKQDRTASERVYDTALPFWVKNLK